MSLIITKIVGSLCLSTSSFLIIKSISNKKEKYFSLYNILIMLILLIPTLIFYKTEYNLIISLLTYILLIFLYGKYFKLKLNSAILICSYIIVVVSLSDLFLTSINIMLFSYEDVRNIWYIAVVNNILVGFISYFISNIKFIKDKLQYLVKKTVPYNINIFIFVILSVLIIGILFYNITSIFKLNIYYTITLTSFIIVVTLYFFYILEINNYEKLNEQYNLMFKYVQDFENWIDDEQMYRHELKNNLSIIRNMTKNKKIIDKIDEMLKFSIVLDETAIEDLKNVPKGGLKGLLYYKVALAKNKKVKMIVEVSSKTTNKLKKLKEKELKELCIILGIYLDNALEAANISKKKIVTLEIYEVKENVNFIISNTYKDIIPIKKMKKKGFSTKGSRHGNGLYYANKLLNKNKWLETNQIFLNDYFIQKITIIKNS